MSLPQPSVPRPFAPPAATATMYRRRLRRQRRGVLATVLALVVLGICGLLVLGILVFSVGAGGVIVGALGALLPVGPVVAAFLWMDRWEPEPPRVLLVAFLWGACFAALAALILNSSAELAISQVLGDGSEAFSAVFIAPWVEEFLKGSFLLGLLLFRRREFDGVLDGIVYAGVVAAGFAFTENILYVGQAFAGGAAEQGGGVLAVLVMRGIFSPFAHPLFTSMIGIGLGVATNTRHLAVRLGAPLGGYLLAVLLHACWNASASIADGAALVPVYLLIMLPMFTFVLLVVLYQRRREQRIIAAELPGFAHAGWIAPSEVHLLESLAGRRGWLRAVRKRSGASVAKSVAEYQAAVTELAILRHRMARGSLGPHAREWHDELVEDVLVSRATAVGLPDALHAAWGRRVPPPGWAPPAADWVPNRPGGGGQPPSSDPGHPPRSASDGRPPRSVSDGAPPRSFDDPRFRSGLGQPPMGPSGGWLPRPGGPFPPHPPAVGAQPPGGWPTDPGRPSSGPSGPIGPPRPPPPGQSVPGQPVPGQSVPGQYQPDQYPPDQYPPGGPSPHGPRAPGQSSVPPPRQHPPDH